MMITRFMSNEDVNEFLDTQDFLSSNSFRSAESEFCKIPYDFDYDDVKRLPDIEDGMDSCIKSVGFYFNEPIYSLQKCFEDLKYSC
ncbi:hypothetical protein NC652_011417 [Populus alba x Populus x berolinensis]|nr:hypothetical protein NC652_011417 [Populus alba x Populus x berolinensis]